MKFVAILALCVMAFILGVTAEDDKYAHVDLDSILENNRVLTNYIKCLLDKGPCTAEGRQLRHDIPHAIQTNCEDCTEKQIEMVRKASAHVMEKRPDDWKKLQDKFDPTGENQERFSKFLRGE